MRTPASVRLFNLQPCESFVFAVLLVANCRETLFSAKFRTNAIFNFKTAPLLRCFLWRKCKVWKFCERSKILQKVKKFATSNYGVRRISNVFACSCRYKTACILTCLGFVFCGENVRFGKFVKGSKILQKVQKFTTSNCGVRRIANVFACFCRYKTACILTCLCAVL